MSILKMPQPLHAEPAKTGAGLWTIWKWRARILFDRILNRLGFPGTIQNAAIDDLVTGQKIRVSVGVLFTKISVDGRDYYFDRLSGRYDGSGSGCGCG